MNKKLVFFTLSITFLLFTGNIWGRSHEKKESVREDLVEYAKKYIGKKYKYGSKGPNSFDCSGFTSYVFSHFGYQLNAYSAAQYTQGEKIKISKTQKGDLIFFKGSNANSKGVGHVGIVTDINETKDTVKFIHASVQSGVVIDNYPGYKYYNIRFIGCRRVIDEVEPEKSTEQDTLQPDEELIPQPSLDTIPQQKEEKDVLPPAPEKKIEIIVQDTTQNNTYKELTHTVKKGETLYRISKQYHCSTDDLKEWNQLRGNNLKIGQVLIIKNTLVDDTPTPVNNEENNAEKENKKEPIQHTVKKGETLYRIGKQYGCTADEIKEWNQLKNNNLSIGQILVIQPKE